MTTPRRKRVPLAVKVSVALVLIVIVPLSIAYVLVGQLGKTAANVAASDASARIGAMNKAMHRYHELVNVTKRMHGELAERVAGRIERGTIDPATGLPALLEDPRLAGLRAIAVVRPDGSVAHQADKPLPGPGWRDVVVTEPVGDDGTTLRLAFEVSASLQSELQELKEAIDGTRTVSQIQSALPEGYQLTFLVVIALAGVLAAGAGIIAATLYTRRIDKLARTARTIAEGHHEARVEISGRDEIAEASEAFNHMLEQLDATRQQVEYLQRMGVWQDVARRLAHEIKNPLTPIQLAVQQCVSSYKGAETDPARFKKLLADTGEIVEEEIASLRRLVDTFRTLGALPKVEASPIQLADVIEELKLDPTMAARLTLIAPARPVTVRADKLLLKRVLANLVENGIHAGQEAGNDGGVVVTWTGEHDAAIITIDDHGKGVSDADREKIFEPYVTTKTTGTGLGLAIARKIAIEHGGELSVAPKAAPTGGARFVVSLPLRGPETSMA